MRRRTLSVHVLVLLLFFAVAPLIPLSVNAEKSAEPPQVETSAAQASTVVFSDGFEGAWPGPWICGDWNSLSGLDYWGRTNARSNTGYFSAWCEGVGDKGWYYDNNMDAYMYRTVSLAGYGSAILRYSYWIDTEPQPAAYLTVLYRLGTLWAKCDPHSGPNPGGWQISEASIPPTANAVGFHFKSQSPNVAQLHGAYVDDVVLEGKGYSATIWSWDYIDGWNIPVPITMDGVLTSYSTLHTFYIASGGTHTFTVPSKNSAGHYFSEWSTGWTDETITVSGTGDYVARYREGYSATIWGWDYISGWQTPVPITMDGVLTGYSTPHTFKGLKLTHKFTVPSKNSAGHYFSEWSTGWTDETIKVDSAGVYTARYRAGYCATIRSWCPVEGWISGLPIWMDGVLTGYSTPHTFSGLKLTHTFKIPSTDAKGHKFEVWSTGWVNEWNNVGTGTTLTVSSAGMYTARYKPGTLTVITPNGGQKWIRGTTHTLTWSSSGSPGAYVKIELMKGGVPNRVITSSTANDGSYSWTIPSTQTLGTDYKIRITSTAYSSISDSSNSNFAIVLGTLTVTSPNGGEIWRHGTVHTITWSKAGSPGSYVKIELMKGGVPNRVITSSTANDGSYSWTIPSTQTLGTDYKIRITSTAYSSISDSSNSNFSIVT